MTPSKLVKRIEELEKEMAYVRLKLARATERRMAKTSRDFIGMFRGDPDFKKAMELGAAYRQSLRPQTSRGRARKK